MIIRSKAPLRLGLAGGGTDVSPYCDEYGGAVLNATIDMYSYCTIEPTTDNQILFKATDRNEIFKCPSITHLDIDNQLILHKGIYNRIIKDYHNGQPLSFRMATYSDAPAGSGLGSSSTMVVAIIKAYTEWLNLPLGEYDMAHLAYQIEREDLNLTGGKQDQFAATFGGFNYMEFHKNNQVIVNPLRIKNWIKNEIESSLILYYLGTSRESAAIIEDQIKNVKGGKQSSIRAMHQLKFLATEMKNAILQGKFVEFANCLNLGWESKKQMASSITNPLIDNTYDYIMTNGGKATKISGAGGGGFMMIVCDPKERYSLIEKLKKREGQVMSVQFAGKGAQAWTLYE